MTPKSIAWLAACSALAALPADALEFNFSAPPGTAPQAVAGFVEAGERWSALFTDDITVNIDIAFEDIPSATGATILGSTGSAIFEVPPGSTVAPTFTSLKAALEADATSDNDAIAVSNLPNGELLQAITNDRSGATFLDNGSSGNNTFFSVTTANAKALGLLPSDDPGVDASISFNSTVSFDFDPSDGITPGAIDFVGVATHEIAHALGFTTGVDTVDVFTGDGPSADADLNGFLFGTGTLEPFAIFTTVDLFRRSEASIALGPDVLDLSTEPGVFFSIDGQPSDLPLETGVFNGTGQQASHFADNMMLGILDPTASPGELLQITENDILAFDVIGYDVGPPPAGLPGDFNSDGIVDAADYTVWRDGLGDEFAAEDFAVWAANFGAAQPSAAAVPEPRSFALIGLGATWWWSVVSARGAWSAPGVGACPPRRTVG